jgi:hypothetical protein
MLSAAVAPPASGATLADPIKVSDGVIVGSTE